MKLKVKQTSDIEFSIMKKIESASIILGWVIILLSTYILLFTDIAMADMTYQEFISAHENAIIEECVYVDAAGGYWSITDERVCILTNLYAFKKVMSAARDKNRFKYIYDICELHNWSGWKKILSDIEK